VYAPDDWEPLGNALRRVIKTGLSEHEARIKLCCAIAERKIAVRVTIGGEYGVPGRVFGGSNVFVPTQLSPNLFDWEQSRPIRPWSIGPGFGEHHWRINQSINIPTFFS
jgi:hypothetical protein